MANANLWLALYVFPLVHTLTRRSLVIVALAVIAALATVGTLLRWRPPGRVEELQLKIEGRVASRQPSSTIFVVRGALGRDGDVEALIRLMGEHGLRFYKSEREGPVTGPDGLIARDDVVIIKVNSQWNERGGTNTDLVKALIKAILSHPDGFVGEIVVADNGQAQYGSYGRGGSLDWDRNNAEDTGQSMQDVVDMFSGEHRVSTYLWDNITTKRVGEYADGDMEDGYVVYEEPDPETGVIVSYPKFRTKYGTYVSFKYGVWDPERGVYESSRLKVINVPVLKTHSIYGVTACVKHYMGVASDKLTAHNAHTSVGTGGMGTMMVETRMPALNILDAIWINPHPRRGPSTPYSEAVRVNILAASTDPVALDYWAAKYILMQAAASLGYRDLSSMDPDNVSRGSFGQWLRLSMDELIRGGYFSTVEEDRISVYVLEMGG